MVSVEKNGNADFAGKKGECDKKCKLRDKNSRSTESLLEEHEKQARNKKQMGREKRQLGNFQDNSCHHESSHLLCT